MQTVEEFRDMLRENRDATTAAVVGQATDSLLRRGAIFRHTELGDNVLDMIAGELRGAAAEAGVAELLALNMVAQESARIGALNPVSEGRGLLDSMKTGTVTEIKPKPLLKPFARTGALFNLGCPVVCIGYATDEFIATGGEILISTIKFKAGILVLADAQDGLNFQQVSESTIQQWRAEGREESDGAREKASEILRRGLAQLESGSPTFAVRASACQPVPNFMIKENWPKIIELIREYLAG